jgi:hypothetical protein
MNTELDVILCDKYPKIFKNRYAHMSTTCMCWGFEHGDGWFNILDALCENIQSHIDRSRRERAGALLFNRALKKSIQLNSTEPLVKHLMQGLPSQHEAFFILQAQRYFDLAQPRSVPEACPQVTAVQVKEKFGTLRFYHDGGDEKIHAMVDLAESFSARTCEVCGSPGKVRDGGWVTVRCDIHAA